MGKELRYIKLVIDIRASLSMGFLKVLANICG